MTPRQGDHAHGHHVRLPLPQGAQGRRTRPSRRCPAVHPHCLRHFFASTALGHGNPVHEVSRWLGHRSIKTTVDVYGHLIPASWDRCRPPSCRQHCALWMANSGKPSRASPDARTPT
ncbi:tyrosine-type recombinase/integrase [Streptomyces lydicus]